MARHRILVLASVTALSAALLRLAVGSVLPAGDAAMTNGVLVLIIGSFVAPLAVYAVLAGAGRPRPERLLAGTVPGTLVAPGRLLLPGMQLISGAWLVMNAILITGVALGSLVLGCAVLVLGALAVARPRPRLVLDADGVTIHSWRGRRTVRVRWSELHPAEPVWTAHGTFIATDRIARISLARAGSPPVPVPAEHLDVEPAYLARVTAALVTAPDRHALIDSRLSTV